MPLTRKLCGDTENWGLYLSVVNDEEKRKSEEQLTRRMKTQEEDTALSLWARHRHKW